MRAELRAILGDRLIRLVRLKNKTYTRAIKAIKNTLNRLLPQVNRHFCLYPNQSYIFILGLRNNSRVSFFVSFAALLWFIDFCCELTISSSSIIIVVGVVGRIFCSKIVIKFLADVSYELYMCWASSFLVALFIPYMNWFWSNKSLVCGLFCSCGTLVGHYY